MRSKSKLPANIRKLPLGRRAELAIKVAVRKAITRRSQLGLPIFIWRNGKVVEMSAKEIREFLSEPA
jgi:hypothetical protein